MVTKRPADDDDESPLILSPPPEFRHLNVERKSRRVQSRTTTPRNVTTLSNEDLQSYDEPITKEYASRLKVACEEGTRRTREVFQLNQRVENLETENHKLNQELASVKEFKAEHEQLKEDLNRLKEEHETTISEGLDLAIRFNTLQHGLEEAKKAHDDQEDIIEKQANVIELAKKATLTDELPWKTFLEAAEKLARELDEIQPIEYPKVGDRRSP